MLQLICTLLLLFSSVYSDCIHDEFIKNTTISFYDDTTDHRFLQAPVLGPLRSFFDYSQIRQGDLQTRIMIKQTMEIVGTFFYNTLEVARLPELFYPNDRPLKCNVLDIPSQYLTQGITADLAVVVGNQNISAIHTAKASPCAFLKSNNRPIWGMISWNIKNFDGKYDSIGFQKLVSIGLHQMTHIIAFSALMYDLYPAGSPLIGNLNQYEDLRLNTPIINFLISQQTGCQSSTGMHLEDQDGTLISSHWQRHHVGAEFMIAGEINNAYVGAVTLGLIQSTGWYTNVSYNYAQPTNWGRNKGCNFLDIDNCDFDQFCASVGQFDCTSQFKEIGRCQIDSFTGACPTYKYFSNTVCNDENYELKNINAQLNAGQRGGHYSKCFRSDYRQQSLSANILNNRCYISICSNNVVYLLIKQTILVCSGQQNIASQDTPPGLTGYLQCPNIQQFCHPKQNCAYNCNNNGLCIDGKCLCTGNTALTQTCNSPDYTNDNFGGTGGRLLFEVAEEQKNESIKKSLSQIKQILNCPQYLIFDPISQKCESCLSILGCKECNFNGCIEQKE